MTAKCSTSDFYPRDNSQVNIKMIKQIIDENVSLFPINFCLAEGTPLKFIYFTAVLNF